MKQLKVLLVIPLLASVFTADLCFGTVVVSSPNLNISCNIQDSGVGVVGGEMIFSNNNSDWSSPESYATTKNWDISDSAYGGNNLDGTKVIYAKFSDALGNWTENAITTTVELRRPVPTFSGVETNIATNATTSTEGINPGNVKDGDYFSYWQGDVSETVSLDFGVGKRVSRMKVYPYGNGGMYNASWKVEYSTPSSPGTWNEFQNVGIVEGPGRKGRGMSIVSGAAAVMYDFVFPEIDVLAIRFSVLQGASDDNAYLAEMEVFENNGINHQVVGVGEPMSIGVLSSFFNSSYSLVYTASSSSNIVVDIQADNSVIMTPADGWYGAEEVYFIATDEHGNSVDSNRFMVVVVPPPEQPVIDSFSVKDILSEYTTYTSGIVAVELTTTGSVVSYLIKEDSATPDVSDFTMTDKPASYTITAAEDGSVTISVWVLSDIGEISEMATDTISLDTTPPTGNILIITQ